MKRSQDVWYVRLPDGRVLRAASTSTLRNHIILGRIPLDIWVRRAPDEEWVSLEWSQDFADMVPPGGPRATPAPVKPDRDATPARSEVPRGGIASRLDALQLQTLGVRGLVVELLAAMDSALVPAKLLVGCVLGVVAAVLGALAESTAGDPLLPLPWLSWAIAGVILWALVAFGDGVLTHMTYLELSALRPAGWVETRTGLARFCFHFMAAYLVLAGSAVGAILVLRLAPHWVRWGNGATGWASVGRYALDTVTLLLEVVLWPVPLFALLLGPILIVEECSAVAALGHWCRLLWQHAGRVFLYEGLAVMVGTTFTLPFAIPLALAVAGRLGTGTDLSTSGPAVCVLSGLVATPLIAYLVVANVFIYLNLRYETNP